MAKPKRQTSKREPESFLPLTPRTFHILMALAREECHGYAIMGAVRERSGGRVRIGPGTLYEAIQRLVASDLIVESTTRPGPDEDQRRRYFGLTDLGKAVLRAEAQRVVDLASQLTDDGLLAALDG